MSDLAPEEPLLWAQAIGDQLPREEGDSIIVATSGSHAGGTDITPRIALWQIEDPRYGFKHVRSVRRDARISSFLKELAALYRRELTGEVVPREAFDELYRRMDRMWAQVGVQKKMQYGFMRKRLGWLGGDAFMRWFTRGWCEAWMWALAATHERSAGQTSIFVWTWARAAGAKPSKRYDRRIHALKDFFLRTLSI